MIAQTPQNVNVFIGVIYYNLKVPSKQRISKNHTSLSLLIMVYYSNYIIRMTAKKGDLTSGKSEHKF
jgi:hypothetical protein